LSVVLITPDFSEAKQRCPDAATTSPTVMSHGVTDGCCQGAASEKSDNPTVAPSRVGVRSSQRVAVKQLVISLCELNILSIPVFEIIRLDAASVPASHRPSLLLTP
jgi:hypothetical protein